MRTMAACLVLAAFGLIISTGASLVIGWWFSRMK
jgi:hypothetical protein